MIFAVVTSGLGTFAGAVAAETTTLAGDGSDHVTGFNASPDDHLEHDLTADNTDFATDGTELALLNITYDGEEYVSVEESIEDTSTASHTFNVTQSALSDLPGDAGQNTTINVTAWGEDANGNETTAATSFDVPITFDSTYAATSVDDDSATIEDIEPGFFASSLDTLSFWSSSSDDTTDLHTYEQTVGVDGDNTTVTVRDETSNGTDAFDDAIGDKSSGDLIYGASASVEGTPVLAFYEGADTDIVNESSTYAVYNGNGVWTFNIGEEHSDKSEVDVYVSSQSYTSVDSFEAADLGSLFIEQASLGVSDLGSGFGYFDTFSSFSLSDLLF